jgi:ribosomal protein S7
VAKTLKEEILAFQQATERLTKDQLTAFAEALQAFEVEPLPAKAVDDLTWVQVNIRASGHWARAISDRLVTMRPIRRDEQMVLSRIANELVSALEETNDAYTEMVKAAKLTSG